MARHTGQKRAAVAAAIACLVVSTAGAQQQTRDAVPKRTLTLKQAVNEAVLRNPNRVRAAHQVTVAGFERDAAEWGRYPTLSVDASPAQSSNALVPASTVRLDQPLWAGGRIDGQIDSARSLLSAAESGEAEERRRLAQDSATAYVGWMYAIQRLDIARAGAGELARLLGYVGRRETSGLASAADVSIASARHGNMLATVAELSGVADQARAQLEALTTARVDGVVPVTVPFFPSITAEETEAAHLANSPLLIQRRAEVESARAQAQVRRGLMLPRVSLRAEHFTYTNPGPSVSANDARISVVLQFAPEAGFASYSGYQAAGGRVDAALAQLAADENEVRLRARSDWAELEASGRQIDQLAPQVASLDSLSASFMRQFEAGRKSWLEVLNTERENVDARLALARARMLRDQATLRLMVNTGTFWRWLETLPL